MELFKKLDKDKKNYQDIKFSLLWVKFRRGTEIGIVGEILDNGTVRVTFENEDGELHNERLTWEEISNHKRITEDSPLEMIVAMGENNEIGKDNTLLWDIPEDMRHFRQVTLGKTVVMGSNTFKSIGKPLPLRKNVILTSDPSQFEGVEDVTFISSVQECLELAEKEEVVVIGGASLYNQMIDHCDIIHVTHVEKGFEADTFFPEIEKSKWANMISAEGIESGTNGISYTFNLYERIDR